MLANVFLSLGDNIKRWKETLLKFFQEIIVLRMISNIPAWFCASINIHEGAARSLGKKHCQGGAENKSNNFGAFLKWTLKLLGLR